MKQLLLSFSLLIFASTVSSQNYYVALVKGDVYYEGDQIKKRDKIRPAGEIRFSSKEDYLKLSGPGGLYTLKPGMDPSSGNEFLIALRKEFFPEVRFHPTVAQGMTFSGGGYYFFWPNPRYTYFKKTSIGKISDDPKIRAIGYVHQTADGLIYRKAFIKDSTLLLRKKDFQLSRGKAGTPYIRESAIVHVYYPEEFFLQLESYKTLDELAENIPTFDSLLDSPDVALIDQTGKEIIQKSPPAMIMDRLGPSRFISRKEVIKDLKFHIKISGAETREEFLEDFAYEYYLIEVYGTIYPASLQGVWEKLGLE